MATTRKKTKRSSTKSPARAVVKTVSPKASKAGYWIATLLLLIPMAYFGITAALGVSSVVDTYVDLKYPAYFATILGVAKILGVIAIFTGRFTWLKEWAYAGFTFDFIAVIASSLFVHQLTWFLIVPVLFLVILHFSYHFWKRLSEIHGIAYTRVWIN